MHRGMRSPVTPGEAELYERDAELALIDARLELAQAGAGGCLVIEGPPGIGKSTLLDRAATRARELGFTVARARGAELEREFGFGLVRQLLGPVAPRPGQAGAELGDAAALAAPALTPFSPVTPGLPPPDRLHSVLHGLYWLCANLAARCPLLLAVDDAHWGDAGSLAFISYLARRLDGVAALLVIARRAQEPGASSQPIDLLLHDRVGLRLEPVPLSARATEQMLRGLFGGPVHDTFAVACHTATRGNPLMVRELATALLADGVEPDREAAARVVRFGPPAVGRVTLARLRRLGPEATALAYAAATLGHDALLRRAAALGELDAQAAATAADALVAAGVLGSTRPLEFVHPLVRNAIYAGRPAAQRAVAHRRAAEMLAQEGADGDRVCAHLLESETNGDPWVLSRLRTGAAAALARGAPSTATVYLRRALEEPPPPEQRPALLLELGQAQATAGDPACAERLNEAIATASDSLTRARAALALARMMTFAALIGDAVQFLGMAVSGFEQAGAAELSFEAEAELVNTALLDTRTAATSARAAARLRRRLVGHHGPGARDAHSTLACVAAIEGDQAAAAAHAETALAWPPPHTGEADSPVQLLLAIGLIFMDRYEAASITLEAVLEQARRRGSPIGLMAGTCFRSHLHFRLGAVAEAQADAREAAGALDPAPATLSSTSAAFLADALLERGELEEASVIVESASIEPESAGTLAHALHTRGRVRAATGRLSEAASDLRDLGRRMETIGARNPGTIPWRSSLAGALAQAGEHREARILADEELDLAVRHGGPRAVGMALLASGACRKGAAGIGRLERAAAVLDGSGARLEHARAVVALGVALCRVNRRVEGREQLRRGLHLSRRTGARALSKEARAQLIAAGGRPRRETLTGVEALTTSELQVARLAAGGRTNPEVAQALFVTRKTVEKHLGNVYVKLGLSTRHELAQALEFASPATSIGV